MVSKEVISKSLDDALVKCMPNFASMHTPKQIAKYFHLKYEGLLNKIPEDSWFYDTRSNYNGDIVEGKVHSFTDPNNDNCRIFVFDDLIEKKTGLLKSGWYERAFSLQKEENNWSEEESLKSMNRSTYPLKQFFKDYDDLSADIKSSIGELVFDLREHQGINGDCKPVDDGKCIIRLHKEGISVTGGTDMITSNPRTTLFHEVGHSFSHKVGYTAEDKTWDFDTSSSYLAQTKDYKHGRKEDKKLNGDRYATEYGKDSKSFDEEQADIVSAMLLKALNKEDSNYNDYYMELAYGGKNQSIPSSATYYETHISIDDFLKRYPNRVKALNKYMGLELD